MAGTGHDDPAPARSGSRSGSRKAVRGRGVAKRFAGGSGAGGETANLTRRPLIRRRADGSRRRLPEVMTMKSENVSGAPKGSTRPISTAVFSSAARRCA